MLSRLLRRESPVCEMCTNPSEHVDHIISPWERPDLVFNRANLRCLCAHHNQSRRGTTDEERAAVHAAIRAPRAL